MRGERAYWCSRGKFYARAVFPPGEGSAWVLLSTGENLYWYTFSGGDAIPGRFFREEVLCGGGELYATTPAHLVTLFAFSDLLSDVPDNGAKNIFSRPFVYFCIKGLIPIQAGSPFVTVGSFHKYGIPLRGPQFFSEFW